MRGIPTLLIAALQLSAVANLLRVIGAISMSQNGEPSLNFLFLGDWGKGGNSGYIASNFEGSFDTSSNSTEDDDKKIRSLKNNGVTYQAAVAKAMGSYSDKFQPSFVVALGDNFYTNGVSSSTDVYWDYLWTNVYLDYYAALRIPWYPVFGNHDYGYGAKGVQAQIDRTLIDDHWYMPSTNYSKTFNIPNGGTVAIIFVDTTTLAPSVNKCCNENGGISTEVQAQRIQNQLVHIEAMLVDAIRNNPTWLLVAGHYPIFSTGEHGDTSELKVYLLPLLQKYKVHAYFCGHDHFSDHLKFEETHYFVAGAGSMTDYVGASSSANALWAGEGYSAFASATATATTLTINYIDTDAAVRYSFTLDNPRAEGPSTSPSMAVPIIVKSSVQVSSNVVLISSGFAALAFVMIAGGFYYESKGKKKNLKVSKTKNSLRALANTRSPRNLEEAMMDLVANKKAFATTDGNEEDADHSLMHSQQNSSIVLGTNNSREAAGSFTSPTSKRFTGKHFAGSKTNYNNGDNNGTVGEETTATRRGPSWEDKSGNAKSQHVPRTIVSHLTSSTLIGVQRSKDGRIFEAIPNFTKEHHKRARTSMF